MALALVRSSRNSRMRALVEWKGLSPRFRYDGGLLDFIQGQPLLRGERFPLLHFLNHSTRQRPPCDVGSSKSSAKLANSAISRDVQIPRNREC
jgi:hypothetical protein